MEKKTTEETAIKKFFKENKSLTFMIPILIILIIVAVIINLPSGDDKETVKNEPSATESPNTEAPLDTDQPKVDVLPQIVRSDISEAIEQEKDPFESPMKLVGVVYSNMKSTAIIEWGGYSYILGLNDTVGNSKWEVARIEKDSITLDNGSENMVLVLTEKN